MANAYIYACTVNNAKYKLVAGKCYYGDHATVFGKQCLVLPQGYVPTEFLVARDLCMLITPAQIANASAFALSRVAAACHACIADGTGAKPIVKNLALINAELAKR